MRTLYNNIDPNSRNRKHIPYPDRACSLTFRHKSTIIDEENLFQGTAATMRYLLLLFFTLILAADEMVRPLPESIPLDSRKVALGKRLFHDPILSGDGTIACADCHPLDRGGADGLPLSFGVEGRRGSFNTPTVLNAVFNFRQFWDGRARDLKEQAEGPITNPLEMDNSFEKLIPALKRSGYRPIFERVYPKEGVTKETVLDAIAEFEKSLITPSPFDRYLRGEKGAMTRRQIEGYRLFRNKGCILCHHGVNLGGTLFSKFGIVGSANSRETGRYRVTEDPKDKYYFKVPTLRNVALTAPYFHDGRTEDLKSAVALMARLQLGRLMTDEEIDKIVAFLNALTGTLPEGSLP